MTRLHEERRKPMWHQYLFQMIVPAVILAMLTYNTGGVAELKTGLALSNQHTANIDNTIAGMRKEFHDELYAHTQDSQRWSARNAIDHHRSLMTPCNKCHTKGD